MPEPLGLESKTVKVVPYDERWPALFDEEAGRIRDAVLRARLPELKLEHVGSTSVAGLAAKPILDIAAGCPSNAKSLDYVAALESVGYTYRGDGGLAGREFFRRGKVRSHHLHLVEDGGLHWQRYLRFRDILRDRRDVRDAYADLKLRLARRYPRDREAYIEGKTQFVEQVVGTVR